jgi:hypothetical protein
MIMIDPKTKTPHAFGDKSKHGGVESPKAVISI